MLELLAHSPNVEESVFEQALMKIADEGWLDIACPYLDPGYLEELTVGIDWRLITDGDECLGALGARGRVALLRFIEANNERIRHKSLLHAKVFIGESKALVGSANLTSNGFLKRDEVGLLVEGPLVGELRAWYDALWSKSIRFTLDEASKRKVKEKRERSSVKEGRVLPDNASRKGYLKSVIKGRRTKEANPTMEGDHRERLLAAIRRAPSREWIDGYFDLLKRAIEVAQLARYPERFVTSCTKRLSINLTINRGFALTANQDHINSIGFILPEHVDPDSFDGLAKKHYSGDNFKMVTNNRGDDPYKYITFVMDNNDIKLIPAELLDMWERIVREQPHMGYAPLPRVKAVHNPLVYQAAVDLDFRKQLLDEAFGGER